MFVHCLTLPLSSLIRDKADSELNLAANLGFEACEDHLNYLMDLRLENDSEMIAALKNEALEEIKAIANKFHKVQLMVVNKKRSVLGASLQLPEEKLRIAHMPRGEDRIVLQEMAGERVRTHALYFPFWQWHIVSFMYEKDYLLPIAWAKKLIYLGTFGVLIAVVFALFLVFNWRVVMPLKRIIHATEGVARGRPDKIAVKRHDEIGRVSLAFNAMVDSIDTIMSELRESEEQYRMLTEHSLANIFIIQDFKIVYANRRAIKSAGYSAEETIGSEIWRLVHPEDRKVVAGRLHDLLDGRTAVDHFECRFQTRYRKMLWLEILAVPFVYRGKPGILGHAIDITEKKASQKDQEELAAKLRRAEKMEVIGTVAGGVAHDLNNVLSGIFSYPELIEMDLPEDSPLKKPIRTIKRSGQKAAAIVEDLLTLTRRGVAVTDVVNLNDIVTDYLHTPEFEKLCSFHANMQVVTHLEPNLLNVIGSPVHLSKTVMNLVSNGAESMPDGGVLTLTTKNEYTDQPLKGFDEVKQGDYVTLNVSDAGIGIRPEDLDRIFEPFYTKKAMGRSGTGLGMAVVWGTVKDHEGYIDVQSGETGTLFKIYFPATRVTLRKGNTGECLESYLGNGESILVVDDIAEQREIVTGMLTKLGYTVKSVSNGAAAVDFMRTRSADLMVLDMIMDPGIDGLETYRQISKRHPGQKAIIASGFSETDRIRKAQRLGAGPYIKKPYILEELGLTVKQELEK